MTSYEYDGANQLLSMKSAEGLRTFKYDKSGRLVEELLDGKTVASYKYGYLDKVTEVNRNGKITKFKYDGFGMLAQKTFHDGKTEDWVWDGMALVMRGNDIYVNEPHVSGGTPLLTKTDKGVRYHTSDFLGTTLWSTDIRGKALDSYADTSVFGEGSIQQDRAARFTGKPYDEDLQAYVFPYRNYDPKLARWRSSDPAGFPDGINQHFYACNPTMAIDPWGLEEWYIVTGGFTQHHQSEYIEGIFVLPQGNTYMEYRIAATLTLTVTGSGTNTVKLKSSASIFLEGRLCNPMTGSTEWERDSRYDAEVSYTTIYSVNDNGAVSVSGDGTSNSVDRGFKKSNGGFIDSTGIALGQEVPTGSFSPISGSSWNHQVAAMGAYENSLSGSVSLGSLIGVSINFSGATKETEVLSDIVNFTLYEK